MSSGIFFSKDRREEVIEMEEAPELVSLPSGLRVPIMSQGEWMKGCPEGSEQSFLFSLYHQLAGGSCACSCGEHSIPRKPSDFFALYVSPMGQGDIIQVKRGLARLSHLHCTSRVDSRAEMPTVQEKLLLCVWRDYVRQAELDSAVSLPRAPGHLDRRRALYGGTHGVRAEQGCE
jgi:hypothetical protein